MSTNGKIIPEADEGSSNENLSNPVSPADEFDNSFLNDEKVRKPKGKKLKKMRAFYDR